MNVSVQPAWATRLSIQQQSVLFLACRGPDGVGKRHDCKPLVVAYRACALVAAKYARQLEWGEHGDSFMSMAEFSKDHIWKILVDNFFRSHDSLPHHFLMHFYHGAQILGFKHPDVRVRDRWAAFYERAVEEMHLSPETEAEMDKRLGDWGQLHWDTDLPAAPTFGKIGGRWGCDTCCTGDRCDDPRHISRANCSVCKGEGVLPHGVFPMDAAGARRHLENGQPGRPTRPTEEP